MQNLFWNQDKKNGYLSIAHITIIIMEPSFLCWPPIQTWKVIFFFLF